jgi:hypothetical protein
MATLTRMKHYWIAGTILMQAMGRLGAADLPNYQIGDQATNDVTTPVALEVIDPKATASLKFEEAIKTPAVFRYYPDTAAVVEQQFQQVCAATQSNFVAAVENTFHAQKVGDEVISSADFGYLLTAFNVKNKDFPVINELAVEWAHGNDGQSILNHSLETIRAIAKETVRADDLPEQFLIGETVRLVPMKTGDEKLTPETALRQGNLIVQGNIITLTEAQNQLRKQFPTEQQPYARALAALLRANCVADPAVTEMIRDNATHQLTVARHFDAGQVIIHRGEVVDNGIKAALDVLNDKLMPGLLNQQVAAERAHAEQEQEQAQTARLQALQAGQLAQQARDESLKMQGEAARVQEQARKDRARNLQMVSIAGGVAAVSLVAVGWIILRRKKTATQPSMAADIGPKVAQAVRDAVMQEMALQRRELMVAQQMAADEIAELVQRLDQVQAPLQERLQAYEAQIQRLEGELAARNEENRELLKAKIELMRRQMEYERVRTSGDWQSIDGGTRN